MNRNITIIILLLTGWLGTLLTSCTTEADIPGLQAGAGPATFYVTIDNLAVADTRASKNSTDNWGIATFGAGDVCGMFATGGRQSPTDQSVYTFPVDNEPMYYEGRTDNYYRFGNAEVVLDPTSMGSYYSLLYYPYYPDMPDAEDQSDLPGLKIRQTDVDGIEKCVDLMTTDTYRINVSNGVMKPNFNHRFYSLAIQRGEGFRNAKDRRIWVVMASPVTDIRVHRPRYEYVFSTQYHPAEGEEVMTRIVTQNGKEYPSFDVNKYQLFETWQGAALNGIESRFAILPPKPIAFLFMQDDYEEWHVVSDFALYTGTLDTSSGKSPKQGDSGYRYILTIDLVGVDVTVRPVTVVPWNDETNITDIYKVGINTYQEYNEWASIYNSYVERGRPEDETIVNQLKNYGDAVRVGDRYEWKFYINHKMEFPSSEFVRIYRLEDTLEGTSTYTNYTISNIRDYLIESIEDGGVLKALDFDDLFIIQPETDSEVVQFGAVTKELKGGTIEGCNIRNAIVVGNNEVGILAGEVKGGTVKNCDISGDVIGTSSASVQVISSKDGSTRTVEGLFGAVVTPPDVTDVRTNGLKFITNK